MISTISGSGQAENTPSSSHPAQRPPEPDGVDSGTSARQKPTLLDGLKSIHPSDFAQVHKLPCARDSFLTGMGAGFCVGGLRLVFSGNPWTSMTYSILSFSLVSAGAHTFCQRRRQIEQASMMRAAEIMSKKKEERTFKAAEMRAEREKRREEHDRQKSAWGRMTGWLSGRITDQNGYDTQEERRR